MEFVGVVYRVLPVQSGTSARGQWQKQEVVFEMPDEFSRKVCVTFFGDRVSDAASLQVGEKVNVSVNIESREYNGRWYTDVRAWRIQKVQPETGGSCCGSHSRPAPYANVGARYGRQCGAV